jgi:alanyl-tRNA synthetase
VVTEAAVTRQERDAWRQKVTDASGQLDQHVQLSDSMTTDLQKEKATSAALKKQLAAANKELTDAQEQATAHQKSAESASESASAAKAEAADLHRQLKESQKAQEASAESSRALAQKDETIKELRARLDDANRKSAAGFTKSVKKGDHGTVVWYGSTRSGPVVIENGRPNVGTLIGSIPHRLCKLELSGTRSSVVVAPSEENDWSRLELKLDPADFAVVRVDWTVIR